MIFGEKKFKMVVIDYPLYALDDPFCAALMGKALKMKYDGYAVTYHENILPMDKTDFFGTHIMLCEETKTGLAPIFAYRSVRLDRCLELNIEFPAISMMKADGHPSCVQEIQKIITKVNDASSISYDSSWAQDLNYRFSNNPELKSCLREIMTMAIVMHHKEFKIPHMITCGVVKVKTDKFFEEIGLKKLNENSNFYENGMTKEECVIFYHNDFSFEARRKAKKYLDLWDNKLVIDGVARKRAATKVPQVA